MDSLKMNTGLQTENRLAFTTNTQLKSSCLKNFGSKGFTTGSTSLNPTRSAEIGLKARPKKSTLSTERPLTGMKTESMLQGTKLRASSSQKLLSSSLTGAPQSALTHSLLPTSPLLTSAPSAMKPSCLGKSVTSSLLAPSAKKPEKVPVLKSDLKSAKSLTSSTPLSLTSSLAYTSTGTASSHVAKTETSSLLRPSVGGYLATTTKMETSMGMKTSLPVSSSLLVGSTQSHVAKSKMGNLDTVRKVPVRVLESDIDLPEYHLSVESGDEVAAHKTLFVPPEKDGALLKLNRPVHDIEAIKRSLINAVSGSLIRAPDFKEAKDPFRLELLAVAERVSFYDAEFVLKVALYTRNELNIRTTANFMLAFASNNKACRPFLRKYYKTSIRLPSDWIDVAEQYQAFYDPSLHFGSLPAALRRVMAQKFPDFDKYQLAKYNKDSTSKKKKKRAKKSKKTDGNEVSVETASPGALRGRLGARGARGFMRGGRGMMRGARGGGRGGGAVATRVTLDSSDSSSSSDSDSDSEREKSGVKRQISGMTDQSETEEEIARKTFTLKQLIRKLHITEPVEHVMCLIGKRYPATSEEFYQCRLPGTFEEERAGKRMKLPTPETWETQVSLKGNKAATWQDLIDHNKLPFMAMLRNLRNMIKAGISNKHHQWVLRKLTDEGAVINSRQFPFRFFSAYEVLEQLEKDYQNNQQDIIQTATTLADCGTARGRGARGGGRGRGGRGRGRGRGGTKIGANGLPEEVPFDEALLKRYRSALDKAVKIATVHNVKPIKGKTLIFVNLGTNMNRPCTSAKGLGKPRTVKDVGVLLGLMCKYSTEDCLFVGYGSRTHVEIELEKGTILHNMESVLSNPEVNMDDVEKKSVFPDHYLYSLLISRQQVDNVIILSDGMNLASQEGQVVTKFLDLYRRIVNPNLLFVSVDLSGAQCGIDKNVEPGHDNDIYIAGYSDQILRFIAERGDGGQLLHVEKIDEAYKLTAVPPGLLPCAPKTAPATPVERPLSLVSCIPRWKTVRVFISSTFRDMHGERDLLSRYVFPELRARASKYFVKVFEVDLRWGVTEEATKSKMTLELCLSQVSRCQLFIGLLGERYGWIPDTYQVPDASEFDWVKNYPARRSVTELEMHSAALSNPSAARTSAFFFIRDNAFQSDVPKICKQEFFPENADAKKKMDDLKARVRGSGLEVFDQYPCHWGGIAEGKPVVAGLEDLGKRALNNLWNALQRHYIDEDNMLDELSHMRSQHEAYMTSFLDMFVGRKSLQKAALNKMKEMNDGLLVLAGRPGSGKSAFTASLVSMYRKAAPQSTVLVHFMGAAPGSTNIVATLRRLCAELADQFSLDSVVAEDYKNLVPQFSELLKRAAEACGGTLVVVVDGVDMVQDTHQARAMEWLPVVVPTNALLVVSVKSDSDCYKALKRRMDVEEFTIGPLQILDKSDVVRQMLSVHRKALDESAFGNQMKLLVNKREANNPFYLSLACQELCMFGVFEQLTSKLKAMAHTVPQLLQEVLARLESDHGEVIVSRALSLLVCCRSGLAREELQQLLSYAQLLQGGLKPSDIQNIALTPEDMVPHAVFLYLARGLQTFLRPSPDSDSTILALSHYEIESAIRQRYFKAGFVSKEIQMHQLLSGFYFLQADPDKNKTWKGSSARAFAALPHHLAAAGLFDELEQVLCDLRFIYAKCAAGHAVELIEDFQGYELDRKANSKAREKFLGSERLIAYKTFVSTHVHILTKHPALLWQQALNEPEHTYPCRDMRALLAREDNGLEKSLSLVEWANKASDVDPCVYTISSMSEAVTCVCVSADSRWFATGSKDCLVRLYDLDTGKQVKELSGHSDGITGMCFVGQDRLCSSSADNTMSLWNFIEGHRINVMKGHKRLVNNCAADSKGKVIVSAGWDCTLKAWNGKTGKFDYDLHKEQTPFNCVSWHPDDSLVVAGSWDSAIRIFDVYNKTRKAVLRGHSSSVRDVAYSPSGRHICSASLDGEVKLWWAANGTQVGQLSGHALPINKLTFSPSGAEVITVSDDRKIKVWSGHLGRLARSVGSEEENGAVRSVCLSPDGTHVAVGLHEGQLRVFHVASGLLEWGKSAHSAAVTAVKYRSDGQALITASADASAKIWTIDAGLACTLTGHSKEIMSVAYGSSVIVTTSHDCTACIYNISTKSKSMSPAKICMTHTAPVTSCALNSDETVLVTVSRDTEMMFWNLRGDCSSPSHVIHACHLDWVTACAWSDTGNFVVTGSTDFSLKVWDVNTYSEKFHMKGHESAINSVAYSHGCIVSCSSDGLVKVWSHKGTEITTLSGHTQKANACDIHVLVQNGQEEAEEEEETVSDWATMAEAEEWKDGHDRGVLHKRAKVVRDVLVASGSDDGTVNVWRPLLGNAVATLTGHSDRVIAVGASQDNKLVTGSLDKAIKMWEPRTLEAPRSEGHDAEVSAISCHPDGSIIITASRDACVKVRHRESDNQECKFSTTDEEQSPISGLAFLKGTKQLNPQFASCSEGGTIGIWTIHRTEGFALKKVKKIKAKSRTVLHPFTGIHCLSNSLLATTNWRGEVQVWDWMKGGRSPRFAFTGHQDWIISSDLSVNSLYTGGIDQTIQCWDVQNLIKGNKTVKSLLVTYEGQSHLPARKRKANWITAVTHCQMWDLAGDVFGCVTQFRAGLHIMKKQMHADAITAIAAASDVIFTASKDGTVKVWDECLVQVGQFFTTSPVTRLVAVCDVSGIHVICGDQLGNISFLNWITV